MNVQKKIEGAPASRSGSRPTGGAAEASPAEPSILSADNLRIWNTLGKTDPAHTKGFSRSGGFKGTAVKPMWITRRLTELFGPCGAGWGFEKPEFQVVDAAGEVLVYCTVTAWYIDPDKVPDEFLSDRAMVYGVGGDKVVTKRQSGPFCDDEAFKKAFTDALGNAFKFIGVAADVHMGLFDDSKYVADVTAEFHPPEPPPAKRVPLAGPYTSKTALWKAVREFAHTSNGIADLGEYVAFIETDEVKELLAQCARDEPGLLRDGLPTVPEYEPLEIHIDRRKRELEEIENIHNTPNVLRAG